VAKTSKINGEPGVRAFVEEKLDAPATSVSMLPEAVEACWSRCKADQA
jgi:hypothetical protein